jgi:hypothetical protein
VKPEPRTAMSLTLADHRLGDAVAYPMCLIAGE